MQMTTLTTRVADAVDTSVLVGLVERGLVDPKNIDNVSTIARTSVLTVNDEVVDIHQERRPRLPKQRLRPTHAAAMAQVASARR